MTNGTRYVWTITKIKKLPHSRNGNPRYEIVFAGEHSRRTKTDASVGYKITDSMVGQRAMVELDGRGSIIDLDLYV